MVDEDKKSGYFAANEDPGEVTHVLSKKADSFFNALSSNEYLNKIADNWRFYYGMFNGINNNHQVNYTGEQGELVNLPVNDFRNIAHHIYVMITASRPSMQARAVNTDYKSQSQSILANGILDYYMRERGLEDAIKTATEMGVVLGSGFIKMEWNSTAGEVTDYDEETGSYEYQGDVEFTNLSPFDVVFDGTKENWKQDWVLIRSFKNKYDLSAKYPELKEQIEGVQTKSAIDTYRMHVWSNDDTDDIAVYEFFHKRTEAMPKGRYIVYVGSEIVLMDTPLVYRTIPVFRLTPGNIMGTPYGYTPMFDIYPLQEALNSIYGTILTNQNAFGVQSLYMPSGANISMASLEGGMNVITADAKPEPIQLTATAPETFNFLTMLVQAMERLSGVNSVTRGNPEASLKSGTALALVQSMGIQYMSGLQQSYVKLVEEVGTQLINNLKDFAQQPRVAAIVGKNNRTLLKEFVGEDLSSINRVIVDLGNPLAKTAAGRVEIASQLLQMKLITNASDYLQVMTTGNLDTMIDNDVHHMLLIKQENERLTDGEEPMVAPTDKHSLHINEHRSVLDDSNVRENPEMVKIVMDHIQKHMDALRNTDPALLQMMGEQPLPPIQSQQAPESQPEQQPQPSQQSLNSNKTPEVLQGQDGNFQPIGNLPKPANPPAPFEDLPTNPANSVV